MTRPSRHVATKYGEPSLSEEDNVPRSSTHTKNSEYLHEPHAHKEEQRRTSSPSSIAVRHRRPASPPCIAALHRRPASLPCIVALHRRPASPSCIATSIASCSVLKSKAPPSHSRPSTDSRPAPTAVEKLQGIMSENTKDNDNVEKDARLLELGGDEATDKGIDEAMDTHPYIQAGYLKSP